MGVNADSEKRNVNIFKIQFVCGLAYAYLKKAIIGLSRNACVDL